MAASTSLETSQSRISGTSFSISSMVVLLLPRDHQARDVAADLVGDLSVADDDLADGVNPAAGHGHAHGPVAVGDADREPAERVGEGLAALRGVLSVRDTHAHALLGLIRVSGLDPAEEHVAELGPESSRRGQDGLLGVSPLAAGSRSGPFVRGGLKISAIGGSDRRQIPSRCGACRSGLCLGLCGCPGSRSRSAGRALARSGRLGGARGGRGRPDGRLLSPGDLRGGGRVDAITLESSGPRRRAGRLPRLPPDRRPPLVPAAPARSTGSTRPRSARSGAAAARAGWSAGPDSSRAADRAGSVATATSLTVVEPTTSPQHAVEAEVAYTVGTTAVSTTAADLNVVG